MAGTANHDRLQPSLLDRLTDDAPDKKVESPDKAVINPRELRRLVMRDIAWLLNTGNLASVENLDAWPEVKRSVLNYGMPDLAGVTVSSMELRALENLMRDAILTFEPRVDAKSLRIRIRKQGDEMSRNALVLDIEGDLWARPKPTRLFLKTELDLESGDVAVTDAGGRA